MSIRSFPRAPGSGAPRSRSLASRPKRLLFERFEERALLAVVANDDGPYTTNEDAAFTLPGGAAEIIVARGSTWSFLDEMTNGQSGTPTETYPLDDLADGDATPGVADVWNSP